MRNTTPRKAIGLKPKVMDESKHAPPVRHIEKMHSPSSSSYVPPKIKVIPPPQPQPQYRPLRLASPPLPPTNPNISFRPMSTKPMQIVGSPRQSLTNTIDVHKRIPHLVFKKRQVVHSPKIADSIVISRSTQFEQEQIKGLPRTEVFKQKQILKHVNVIARYPSQTSLQQNPQRKDAITASKLRDMDLPIRYQSFKDRFSEKYSSDSLTNISDVRVHRSPVKIQQIHYQKQQQQQQQIVYYQQQQHHLQIQIQKQQLKKQQQFLQQQKYLQSNETLASSSNKITTVTKKMSQIVRINETLESQFSEIEQLFESKDSQNKRMKKKITELTEKSKQIKKQSQKLEDQNIQFKSKIQSQIDSIKVQYGSDLFKAQTQLNNFLTTKKSIQNNVFSLQKQQQALDTQLYQFHQLFKSIQSGFSQVKI